MAYRKRHPAAIAVERLLRKHEVFFIYHSPVGWKIYDDARREFSWLEYRHDPHVDRIHLSVDKLRDGAENFARLVSIFHGLAVDF